MSSRRARSRGVAGHANHERWLLPYADMLTLLLALFVVLYSISSVNNAKLDQAETSIQKAFSGTVPTVSTPSQSQQTVSLSQAQQNALLNAGSRLEQLENAQAQQQQAVQAKQSAAAANRAEDARLERLRREILAAARRDGFASQVSTVVDQRGLVIRLLTDKVLFDTGSADIRSQAKPLLMGISHILEPIPNAISVDGYTDTNPIDTPQFPSNWELSATRATTVVRYFITNGLASHDLSATGYADRHPLASNASDAGRALNRRVEVVILRSSDSDS